MTQGEIHRRFARGEITSAEAAALTLKHLQPMRGIRARVAAWIAGGAAALAILSACPPPKPPVGPTPDASDAAPAPAICDAACAHYAKVCANSGVVCYQTCPGAQAADPGYAVCVAGAAGCMNCDATARAAAGR